jgi:hypothetical protein
MLYHTNINLPINFIPHDFGKIDGFCELGHPVDERNRELLNWLQERELTTRVIRYFQSPPLIKYPLHVDGLIKPGEARLKDIAKINIVYESTDCVMSWFQLKPSKADIDAINFVGEKISYFDEKECDLLYSTECNQTCLINGGIIHTLQNGSNNGNTRRCYSIFLVDVHTNKYASWDYAVEKLKDVIVPQDSMIKNNK